MFSKIFFAMAASSIVFSTFVEAKEYDAVREQGRTVRIDPPKPQQNPKPNERNNQK